MPRVGITGGTLASTDKFLPKRESRVKWDDELMQRHCHGGFRTVHESSAFQDAMRKQVPVGLVSPMFLQPCRGVGAPYGSAAVQWRSDNGREREVANERSQSPSVKREYAAQKFQRADREHRCAQKPEKTRIRLSEKGRSRGITTLYSGCAGMAHLNTHAVCPRSSAG